MVCCRFLLPSAGFEPLNLGSNVKDVNHYITEGDSTVDHVGAISNCLLVSAESRLCSIFMSMFVTGWFIGYTKTVDSAGEAT
jgi:hypothetical protein